MSSYVYMKILESRPRRYDRGVALMSLGAADRCRRRLVAESVRPGVRMLEIGCGTGTLALLAARAGAEVLGFDVSGAMLAVARDKVHAAGLSHRVQLEERGVSSMDGFADEGFDLVAATLVFSELSPDERAYAVRHAHRVLRPAGCLALADEVRPRARLKRWAHAAVRVPLLLVTFALTQTTTRAVEGLPDLVSEAGFRIESSEWSALDSFLYLVAAKEPRG